MSVSSDLAGASRLAPARWKLLRVAGVLVLVSIASVATSGCSSSDDPALGSTRAASDATPSVSLAPSTAIATQDDLASARLKALAAYREMWAAYEVAIKVPDPADPELAWHATGSALNTLVDGLTSTLKDGLKGTGDVKTSPRVTKVGPVQAPAEVELEDCLDSSGTHLVNASPGGKPYTDTPGGKRLTLATVQRQVDGAWKVTSFGVRAIGTC